MFTEDLSQFVNPADFGEVVTRANASTFNALFYLQYVDPLGVAGNDPAITTLASVSLVRHELLTIRGVQYRVASIEPDGTGMVSARLTKQ